MRPGFRRLLLFLLVVSGSLVWAAEPSLGPDPSPTLRIVWEKFETEAFPDLRGWVSVTKGSVDLTGLGSGKFRLFEDGQEQPNLRVVPETEGVVIALLVDTSGSMRESVEKAKTAVREFVRHMRPEDQALLILFDDEPRLVQPLTSDKTAILRGVSEIRSKGGTALYDSIGSALDQLTGIHKRKVVVLMTDGSDQNAEGTGPGSRSSLDSALAKAILQETTIFTIGLGIQVERKVLRTFSESTGGLSLWATEAGELRTLYREIAQYIHSRYRVYYRTLNPWRDGALRRVRLQVQDGKWFGEGITSYWTSKSMPAIRREPTAVVPPLPGPFAATPTPNPVAWKLDWGGKTAWQGRPGRVRLYNGKTPLDPHSGELATWPGGKPPDAYVVDGFLLYLQPGMYRFTQEDGSKAPPAVVFEVQSGIEKRVDVTESP